MQTVQSTAIEPMLDAGDRRQIVDAASDIYHYADELDVLLSRQGFPPARLSAVRYDFDVSEAYHYGHIEAAGMTIPQLVGQLRAHAEELLSRLNGVVVRDIG